MKTAKFMLWSAGALFGLAGCQGTDNAFLSSKKQEAGALAAASAESAGSKAVSGNGFEKVNISIQVNVYNGKGKKRRRGGGGKPGMTGDSLTLKHPPSSKKDEAKTEDSPSFKEMSGADSVKPQAQSGAEAATAEGEKAKMAGGEKPAEAGAKAEKTTVATSPDQTKTAPAAGKQAAAAEKAAEKAPALPKTDILFYLGFKGDGTCWDSLSRSVPEDGFFSHLKDSADWRAATAFQADEPELYFFRKSPHAFVRKAGSGLFGAKEYVLNKDQFSDEESDEFLGETVQAEYLRDVTLSPTDRGARPYGEPQFPLEKKPPFDPLSGLDKLLAASPADFLREDSKTIVVLLEFDHYYYKKKEWQAFKSKHKAVHFVPLSSHRGTAANYPRKLKKRLLFCDGGGLSSRLAERIKKILSKK